jgi:hypothetical protein
VDKGDHESYIVKYQLAGGVCMARKSIAALFALLALTISCSHKPSTPTQSTSGLSAIVKSTHPTVSFAVTVHDSTGAPVPNLRVTLINEISIAEQFGQTQPIIWPQYSGAGIGVLLEFGSPGSFRVRVRDLNDSVYAETELRPSGISDRVSQFVWSDDLPLGVYKTDVQIFDPGSDVPRFKDSVIAVRWIHRPEAPATGFTSDSGRFETHDPRIFPCLWDLPPLNCSIWQGTILDTFSFTNKVVVDIVDTLAQSWMSDTTTLDPDGANEVTVTWQPIPTSRGLRERPVVATGGHPVSTFRIGDLDCDGVPFQDTDLFVFKRYLLLGVSALGTHVDAASRASDINGDGQELTLADYTYMRLRLNHLLQTVPRHRKHVRDQNRDALQSLRFTSEPYYGGASSLISLLDSFGYPIQLGAVLVKLHGHAYVEPTGSDNVLEYAMLLDTSAFIILPRPNQYWDQGPPSFSSWEFMFLNGASVLSIEASTPYGEVVNILPPAGRKDTLFPILGNPF